MLEQIRKKRLSLTQGITRPRITSADKRKAIEASLSDFKKDLHHPPSKFGLSRRNFTQSDRKNDDLLSSPTMKDIVPLDLNQQQQKHENIEREEIESPRFKSDRKSQQLEKQLQDQIQKQSKQEEKEQREENEKEKEMEKEKEKREEIPIENGLMIKNQSFGILNSSENNEKGDEERKSSIKSKEQQKSNVQLEHKRPEIPNIKIDNNISLELHIHQNGEKQQQQIQQKEQQKIESEINIEKTEDNHHHNQKKENVYDTDDMNESQMEMGKEKESEKIEQTQKVQKIEEKQCENDGKQESIRESGSRRHNQKSIVDDSMKLDRSEDSASFHQGSRDISNAQFNYSMTEASVDGVQREEEEQVINTRKQDKNNRVYSPSNSKSPRKTIEFPSPQVKHVVANVTPPKQELQKIKQSEEFQPTYEKPEGEGTLNFNYNESHYGSSSNNSSAIFFTSQFKEYLNRDKQPQNPPAKEVENVDSTPITQRSIESEEKKKKQEEGQELQKGEQSEGKEKEDKSEEESVYNQMKIDVEEENTEKKRLRENKSGPSLAYSHNEEQSSLNLKYSRDNESAVQEMVNKKLDEQLVLEIGHFSRNKFITFIEDYLLIQQSQLRKDMKLFTKTLLLQKKILNSFLRRFFDSFLANQEQQKFNTTKNEIKAQRFQQQSNEVLLKKCFEVWRDQFSVKNTQAIAFRMRKDAKMKASIFKIFRMFWYDARVGKQADLYYLSKIFSALREVGAKEKKRSEHAALKLYCQNLKKNYFNRLYEGVENSKRDKEVLKIAKLHDRQRLLRKYLEAWLSVSNREPQFISLTMTSKNAFKETLDHRWLHTKTVDFRQIK